MNLVALKKLISLFLHPLPILLGVLVLGLLLYFFGRREPKAVATTRVDAWSRESVDKREKIRRRRRRWGRLGISQVWLSIALLYLLGLEPVSKLVARPLEVKYPILDPASADLQADPPAFIVVLGGGYTRARNYPITSRLPSTSLVRVTEALRLYQSFPGALLLFSGGDMSEGEDQRSTVADAMAEMAKLMGVPEEAILLERDSRDTRDHPLKIRPIVGEARRVVLVTSAMHLPRAMAIFEKQGFAPIPAPAGLLPSDPRLFRLTNFIPSVGNYARVDAASHEYLGLLWARMRGQID